MRLKRLSVLAALSGGMLGGALIARGTPYLPGYKASNVSLTGAAAQQLQRWGVPDWNIRLAAPQPGVLYSNPLPVTLERVGPSSVGLGGSAPVAFGTPYRQLSSKAYAALQEKVKNRTITKDEWQRLNWSDRLTERRQAGIDSFWTAERQRLEQGMPGTRNWNADATQRILDSGTPRGIFAHHRYSVSQYPQLANDPSTIFPATFREHFYKWHGGNWKNPSHGTPVNPNLPDDF